MASLNKLAIRGIRSFDDKNISVIEFFSPVTVIVGHNGSGKTTIIECLKYATTGDQPPNTRGGAFVHDPNMANEKEVKAQVKLRFHAANGTRMLAVRNLSVTKKKGGLTMKTLEGILSIADAEKTGKRGTISTKCAEMDAEMPHLLGVSKSVLENVIFCHQEESYWPLAEASVLKKKFDDIFEATRYTKALDSIKSLRKERVADQKAEKERLESLSKEKAHADKLSKRLAELSSSIAAKKAEYEETKKEYDDVTIANQKFHDQSTRFREIYMKQEQLIERRKDIVAELETMKAELKEVPDSDELIDSRLKNFDSELAASNQKRREKQTLLSEEEDSLSQLRSEHVKLVERQADLQAGHNRHQENIKQREVAIRTMGSKYGIKGYDHSPLEVEQVAEFCTRLSDIQKKQNQDTESLQSDGSSKTAEYQAKLQTLNLEAGGLRMQKDTVRAQIVDLQKLVMKDEADLDAAQTLAGDLQRLASDMEDKQARLEKMQADFSTANYNVRLEEKVKRIGELEVQRNSLNGEFRTLSSQADTRAKFDLKRAEVKSKAQDIKNILQIHNTKFRSLVGVDPKPETLERDIEQAIAEKDNEYRETEDRYHSANRNLQTLETTVSNIQKQLIQKQKELKDAEKKVKAELDGGDSVAEAVKEALAEVSVRKETSSSVAGTSKVYESMLKQGKTKKLCLACNRHLSDHEMIVYEKFLNDQIQKASKSSIEGGIDELEEWENELARLQELLPIDATRERLKNVEIPALETQKSDQEALIPDAAANTEKIAEELAAIRRQQKELGMLKQHAINVSQIQKDITVLQKDIASLERDLVATGSTRTADDVEQEIDGIQDQIRTLDREKLNLANERDRSLAGQRNVETELLKHEVEQSELRNKLKDRDMTESRISINRVQLATLNSQAKDLDAQIAASNAPIVALEEELRQFKFDINIKIKEAQSHAQELNRSVDQMEQINKTIMDYERQRRGRKLQECSQHVEDVQAQIAAASLELENIREAIRLVDRDINLGGAVQANLRENARFRKLKRDIVKIDKDIGELDIEEAARAKRNFETKWSQAQQRATDLMNAYSALGGEITSMEKQLSDMKDDQNEYKGITKRYTDQLVKVKMADMANADLEKYAKALDNAIMKYHSLKMEEVNDTMRHLWNKTYQGTDIDGIKIASDSEGGTAKRTYNYRVVMTKDQVEMDMRGRCSAGQKMLASIIIRLALSDSFGQNCGILALDEPTNALDTENIDALAASLVDIINERKNHANFQLIIITHDENFLRKLGQSDVMEYYWRVSRDSRQKSVIERERFG
ncbi:hypothetical protein BU17DRAFT_57979 [Hysterangium stoloniferum]|nr:hypothetical protein BU17DRAFT_57979 [Hysterangium stoloniferum]